MLGIDVNIKVKKIQFPINYDFSQKNICVHCGAEGTLTYVDKFGNPTREEIHPFDHIECKRCGQKYTIRWIDGEDDKKHPYPSDPSIARQFMNYFGKKINRILGRE